MSASRISALGWAQWIYCAEFLACVMPALYLAGLSIIGILGVFLMLPGAHGSDVLVLLFLLPCAAGLVGLIYFCRVSLVYLMEGTAGLLRQRPVVVAMTVMAATSLSVPIGIQVWGISQAGFSLTRFWLLGGSFLAPLVHLWIVLWRAR